MSDNIISVQNLSKRFVIAHEARERYTSIRDVVTRSIKKTFSFGSNKHIPSTNQEDFWALKDLEFEIKRGDRLGIIGRNGAGKSTLLKILSRITEPTTGKITIDGRVASLLEVGTGFHPELTGRENIFLNGAILGMSRTEIRKKFDEIISFAEVEKFLDTPVKRYSSGMYVRLAFAVAANLEPEILIVDEVLAVGDAQFQKKCLGKMKDVSQNQDRTVLFVSHNLTAINSLCTKGLVLDHGRIGYYGDVQGAVASYLNQFVNGSRKVSYSVEKAKGNDFAKLRSASVKGLNMDEDSPIKAGESIMFEFRFDVSGGSNTLDITFHLLDEFGVLVFVGSTGFDVGCSGKFGSDNKKLARCIVPSNLMNEGTYSVSRLLLVKDRGFVALEVTDVIQFDIMPQTNTELGWMGGKEGTVKPDLEWSISEL